MLKNCRKIDFEKQNIALSVQSDWLLQLPTAESGGLLFAIY